jgi:hypothetical protein
MVVLIDSKGENKDNLYFFQELKQTITITPLLVAKSTPFIVPSSSKPNLSKIKKKHKNSTMVHEARSMFSPKPKRLILTPTK